MHSVEHIPLLSRTEIGTVSLPASSRCVCEMKRVNIVFTVVPVYVIRERWSATVAAWRDLQEAPQMLRDRATATNTKYRTWKGLK